MEDHYPRLTFKFILVGNSNVGKTSMCKMFCEQVFDEVQPHTLGVEFGNRTVIISGIPIKLQFWDTAGQEKFRSITKSYFRSATAVFTVFDVTQRDSFSDLIQWIEDSNEYAPNYSLKIIVGNKTDLISKRVVSEAEAIDFAQKNGYQYFETSALSGNRIEETFLLTAENVYKKIVEGKIQMDWNNPKDNIFDQPLSSIGIEKNNFSNNCC